MCGAGGKSTQFLYAIKLKFNNFTFNLTYQIKIDGYHFARRAIHISSNYKGKNHSKYTKDKERGIKANY